MSENGVSAIAAIASAIAAFCAAWAAWEAVGVSKLQYESEIKRIKFSFHKMNDDWEIKVSQLTGQSYDLASVTIKATLADPKTNALTYSPPHPINTNIIPGSIYSNRPYPIYEIRNVKNNICRNDICNGRRIDELEITYKIYERKQRDVLK